MFESAHIEGAVNVPGASLKNADLTLKSTEEIRKLYSDAGVDLAKPIVTYCNSGMQASFPFPALH